MHGMAQRCVLVSDRESDVRSIAVRAAHVDAAEAREQLLRVAARDREADALVGDAPDARRRRARVEAVLGLQPGRAADRELDHFIVVLR
jgi:hypothetical protein